MELIKKFKAGQETLTYQRIDSDFQVNVFLGYNDDGQMSMVITEKGCEASVKSSKIIDVQLKRREDKKLALSFDLIDESYKSMFLIFCKDIILTCEKAGNDKAITCALTRWKYWQEMFCKKKLNIMEKFEIKGLIGELIELSNNFLCEWDETVAIACWMGPLSGHKDFEIERTWYEVKSVNENASQVAISSLEQLESEVDGHLVIVRLEETSSVNHESINLNQAVLSIIDKINDPDNLESFRIKLEKAGYQYDAEYDNINYMYKGTQRYIVGESFPRLRRSEISPCIGNVQYTIFLQSIAKFKEV